MTADYAKSFLHRYHGARASRMSLSRSDSLDRDTVSMVSIVMVSCLGLLLTLRLKLGCALSSSETRVSPQIFHIVKVHDNRDRANGGHFCLEWYSQTGVRVSYKASDRV